MKLILCLVKLKEVLVKNVDKFTNLPQIKLDIIILSKIPYKFFIEDIVVKRLGYFGILKNT